MVSGEGPCWSPTHPYRMVGGSVQTLDGEVRLSPEQVRDLYGVSAAVCLSQNEELPTGSPPPILLIPRDDGDYRHLEPLDLRHAPAIYAYLCDDDESGDAFFQRPSGLEDTRGWIRSLRAEGALAYVVVDRDGRADGVVTLRPGKGHLWIGYFFRRSVRGRHNGRFAAQVMQMYPALRVTATPRTANIRSQRVLMKAGFVNTGRTEGDRSLFVREPLSD